MDSRFLVVDRDGSRDRLSRESAEAASASSSGPGGAPAPNLLRIQRYNARSPSVSERNRCVPQVLMRFLRVLGRLRERRHTYIFWQFAPAPLWNRLLRELSATYQLDNADEARLLAMVNLAAADGAISCWNDKYYWNFWRPRAAIQEADTDGNPATVADPSWEPLFHPSTATVPPLITPPFPDHPSGHGCASGAVLHTARHFFGTDKVAFAVHSGRFPGQPRHFERFSHALDEIVDARVWGGIHFRTADEQGALIGKNVARWLRKHYFHRAR